MPKPLKYCIALLNEVFNAHIDVELSFVMTFSQCKHKLDTRQPFKGTLTHFFDVTRFKNSFQIFESLENVGLIDSQTMASCSIEKFIFTCEVRTFEIKDIIFLKASFLFCFVFQKVCFSVKCSLQCNFRNGLMSLWCFPS